MPLMTFTSRGVAALKPQAGRRVDYWSDDPQEPGFGVRVFASGAKSWFQYTRQTRNGAAVRVTLGSFPTMGLAKARTEAETARAKVKTGTNPADEHRTARQGQRETVAALLDAYETHVEVRRKAGAFTSWPDVKRSLERDVIPAWGDRPARAIKRRDVLDLVTAKAITGPVAANRLQAHVSMLLAFGVEAEWLDVNVAHGLKKRREAPRTRVLSPADVRALWLALDHDGPLALARGVATKIVMPSSAAPAVRDVFKLLLLLGQRLGETSRMRWADVDLEAGVWTIPATDTKNRDEHRVPLSRAALDVLNARHEAAGASAYVFTSGSVRDASVFVWTKRAAPILTSAIGVPFTAHDLRRTFATQLGELGVEGDVIGLVLNHRKAGVTGRHYDHSRREAAKRAALDRWAQRLDQIIREQPATVTPIRGRA